MSIPIPQDSRKENNRTSKPSTSSDEERAERHGKVPKGGDPRARPVHARGADGETADGAEHSAFPCCSVG